MARGVNLKRWLVGGAVRDGLLGRGWHERDWVVTGATAEDMLALGYRRAGAKIPVFIDPETGEEHALARLERKVAPGHKGFLFESSPDVTLEEDLRRRDLTINAMARDDDGTLVDPCGGQSDLESRLLRHVSDAFSEDPLRVLRVARFAAELGDYNFAVAEETLALMKQMADSGELASLPAERVWRETERALRGAAPRRYFATLAACDALPDRFAELLPQLPQHLQRLHLAVAAGVDAPWRWAALLAELPVDALDDLSRRLKSPNLYVRTAKMAQALLSQMLPQLHGAGVSLGQMRYELLRRADALRRPEMLTGLVRLHDALHPESSAEPWLLLRDRLQSVAKQLQRQPEETGLDYANRLRAAQVAALQRQL